MSYRCKTSHVIDAHTHVHKLRINATSIVRILSYASPLQHQTPPSGALIAIVLVQNAAYRVCLRCQRFYNFSNGLPFPY